MNNMKRLVISVVALLLVLNLFSQAPTEAKKNVGLRFGMQLTPTISWFSSDEVDIVEPDGSIVGYSFGVVGDWFFKENYALATGFFMNSMGGKLIYDESMPLDIKNTDVPAYPNGEVTLKPNYLEIPIGFKFLTKDFWRVKLVGQAGYNQFILLNATVRHDGDLDKKDAREEFTSVMSAYHFGFGAEYALGGDAYLTAGVLATIGLNDVTKSVSDTGIDPVNKLNSINFKLGVIF